MLFQFNFVFEIQANSLKQFFIVSSYSFKYDIEKRKLNKNKRPPNDKFQEKKITQLTLRQEIQHYNPLRKNVSSGEAGIRQVTSVKRDRNNDSSSQEQNFLSSFTSTTQHVGSNYFNLAFV